MIASDRQEPAADIDGRLRTDNQYRTDKQRRLASNAD
jgi:hypothetical protein